MINPQIPTLVRPTDARYYVENRPQTGHESLRDARCAAGLMQHHGVHRSLLIYQNGEVVDLKRF